MQAQCIFVGQVLAQGPQRNMYGCHLSRVEAGREVTRPSRIVGSKKKQTYPWSHLLSWVGWVVGGT